MTTNPAQGDLMRYLGLVHNFDNATDAREAAERGQAPLSDGVFYIERDCMVGVVEALWAEDTRLLIRILAFTHPAGLDFQARAIAGQVTGMRPMQEGPTARGGMP